MENHEDKENPVLDDDFLFYSLLYSSITVAFAMAVLSKFLTNQFRFGFRSLLSLIILFIGEPMCHFLLKGPTGVLLFGLGCFLVYSILPASHLPVGGKAVLITGCDSGFGHALAKKLDGIGIRVFAGCLHINSPGAIDLQNNCTEKLKLLQLDVTDSAQIQKAYEVIEAIVKSEGLWGLVNNAGVCYVAELEMTPVTVFKKTLDVNLLGMVCVTKAFLPLIRHAKGRIVNVTSVTGHVPLENIGAYCVSKSGMESYSDVLRKEMRKWGVKVAVVQPAGYMTEAVNVNALREKKEEIWASLDDTTRLAYGRLYLDQIIHSFEKSCEKSPADLTPVTRAIRSALLSKRPRHKYPCGLGAETLLTVFPILPIWLADKLATILGTAVKDVNPVALQK